MKYSCRFGSASKPLERGRVSPGTYCTRQFEECYRKTCRLQSPNYPGMYPRNVTCYWSLRQKAVPTCKHAMVSVKQNLEQKVNNYLISIIIVDDFYETNDFEINFFSGANEKINFSKLKQN